MSDSRPEQQRAPGGQTGGSPAAVNPEGLSRARRWACAAVLAASLLVVMMDMTILNIAIPDLTADLRPGSDQVLWIVDVYSLVLAGLLVSTATLGDRWGRKRMLVAGYAVFGAASVLVFWAESAEFVIALRVLLGVGGAMIMPTTLSMLRAVFTDPKERAIALGLWASVAGVGAGIGPIVGGVLLEFFSWHAAFLVNVPLMAVAVVAALIILPESRAPRQGRWDWLGALVSLAGMVLLVWSFKRFAKEETLLLMDGWITLLLAAALLTWFVRRCLHRPDPLLDMTLFARRQFTAGIVAALGVSFAMAAALLLLAQWLQLVHNVGPIEAGVRLLPLAVAATIGSIGAPWVALRIGARPVIGGGIITAGLGLILLFVAPNGLTDLHVFFSLLLVGAGMGSVAIGSALVMSGTPNSKAGNAAAFEETSVELGNALGVAILGSIAAIFYRAGIAGDAILDQLPADVADAAQESIGAATAIAQETGLVELATAAGTAFTTSMQQTSLLGGIIMIIVGITVVVITPKGTDITHQHE